MRWTRWALVVAVVVGTGAWADGGAEKASPSAGPISLRVDWGAALPKSGVRSGTAPMFVGGTLSFWASDWVTLDLSGEWLLPNDRRVDLLIGPRFRTQGYPVSFSLGVQGGAIFLDENRAAGLLKNREVHFGISPNVGLELTTWHHLLMGLHYALDLPFSGGDLVHRVYVSLGYRF